MVQLSTRDGWHITELYYKVQGQLTRVTKAILLGSNDILTFDDGSEKQIVEIDRDTNDNITIIFKNGLTMQCDPHQQVRVLC